MKYDYKDLRKRIRGMYDNYGEFAEAVGLSRVMVSSKLNNKTDIKRDDMLIWGAALNLDESEYVPLFLRPLS